VRFVLTDLSRSLNYFSQTIKNYFYINWLLIGVMKFSLSTFCRYFHFNFILFF
jgi:hypothetical protein